MQVAMSGIASHFADRIAHLVASGGPLESEYSEFSRSLRGFRTAKLKGRVSEHDHRALLDAFGAAMSHDTMQGQVLQKRHGYAGDYEVIDRIYTRWMSPQSELANWDRYFHAQPAAAAVRNRKAYLHGLLDGLEDGARVLNLGSGPGRCMAEWLDSNPDADVSFDCVDFDRDAINHAQELNAGHLNRVSFHEANVLRYHPSQRYDLIWASGLFDYFRDRVFRSLARRMMSGLSRGGQLVIGSFAVGNPSQAYMELGEWVLLHRTPDELRALMLSCGASDSRVHVEAEPEGVNLFVHAERN